jgi:hypothetical protein
VKKIVFFFLLVNSINSFAQKNIRDSISFPMIGASFQFQLPGADMAKRFGYNFNVGGFFQWKLKSNWLFGVDGEFIFSDQVKDNVLSNLMTDQGQIIGSEGVYATYSTYERGFLFSAKAGKILNVLGPNPNSGLLATFGAGILQHKIRIEMKDNDIPELKGDYMKGYDRLTNGIALTEFIGYINCSNSRLINFYAGFELTQAFTKSRRDWDFEMMMKDNSNRIDLLFGVKAGWFFPIYKHSVNTYYVN